MKKKEEPFVELDKIGETIRKRLAEKDAQREQCLKSCREIVRLSSTSIRAIHRGEKEAAKDTIESAASLVNQIRERFKSENSELLFANYVHDAFKEYAEASITYGVIFLGTIPGPDSLGISHAAYLNGLAESVGEMRRYILDRLRSGNYITAESLMNVMDRIYSLLVTMDFPDALTYGLRRNTDNVRGIVEKTRSDLTIVMHNNVLQGKISNLSAKLRNSADQV